MGLTGSFAWSRSLFLNLQKIWVRGYLQHSGKEHDSYSEGPRVQIIFCAGLFFFSLSLSVQCVLQKVPQVGASFLIFFQKDLKFGANLKLYKLENQEVPKPKTFGSSIKSVRPWQCGGADAFKDLPNCLTLGSRGHMIFTCQGRRATQRHLNH